MNNSIIWNASPVQHASAYLEFETHTHFIARFLFRSAGVPLPARGMVFVCYSRFDHCLPALQSVTVNADGLDDVVIVNVEGPLRLELYNWTGDGFCGVHYDPVYNENLIKRYFVEKKKNKILADSLSCDVFMQQPFFKIKNITRGSCCSKYSACSARIKYFVVIYS